MSEPPQSGNRHDEMSGNLRDTRRGGNRRDEVSGNLHHVRARIDAACRASGRRVEDVRLLAVTKTFPASDVAVLGDLGMTDFAENRDQEAARKVGEFAALRAAARPRWHMVGRLQRNKARSVARWADEVQSVDSRRLAEALATAVRKELDGGGRSEPLDVLVQVSLDEDTGRGGCPPGGLDEVADVVAAADALRLRGVMAVAPLGGSPDAAFEDLAAYAARLRHRHPDATELSAGMSGDMEQAIAHGSTCVRVGTALLGHRPLASPQDG